MTTSAHTPEMQKRPPLTQCARKWEYSNTLSKITLRVQLAEDGVARVAYFHGVVTEDEPRYAVAPDYVPAEPEVKERDEDEGIKVLETALMRIRIHTGELKVDFYDLETDEPLLLDENGYGREHKDWTGDAKIWMRKRLQET